MNRDLLSDQDQALTEACPLPPDGCGSAVSELCTRLTATGERVPLERFPAHIVRIKRAGVIHAPWDSRDLRRGD